MTPQEGLALIKAQSDRTNAKTTVTVYPCPTVPSGATLPKTDVWASATADLRYTLTFLYVSEFHGGPDIFGAGVTESLEAF